MERRMLGGWKCNIKSVLLGGRKKLKKIVWTCKVATSSSSNNKLAVCRIESITIHYDAIKFDTYFFVAKVSESEAQQLHSDASRTPFMVSSALLAGKWQCRSPHYISITSKTMEPTEKSCHVLLHRAV